MLEFYQKVHSKGLTPNQLFVLQSLNTGLSISNSINLNLEVRILEKAGWLSKDHIMTEKAIQTLIEIDAEFFKIEKEIVKTSLGDSYDENVKHYRELFPGHRINGSYLRISQKNLEKNFKWFFKNHEYSWKTIFKATEAYLHSQRESHYKYCKRSGYFIKKNDLSELADWCENIKDAIPTKQNFSNVVE